MQPTPPILQFFDYEHLPHNLQNVSKPFGELARTLAADLPSNAEASTALRKLLEAKDCAVRAVLHKDQRVPLPPAREVTGIQHA